MRRVAGLAILTVFLFSGCVATSMLANSIEGRITDHNGNPIKGAIITTAPSSSSVSTDADGKYIIRKLKSREYSISVFKTGYAEETVTVLVGGLDYPTRGDIQILPESMLADENAINEPVSSLESESKKEPVADISEKSKDSEKKKKKKNKKWWEK